VAQTVHSVRWRPVRPAQGDTGVYLMRLRLSIPFEFMDNRMDNAVFVFCPAEHDENLIQGVNLKGPRAEMIAFRFRR